MLNRARKGKLRTPAHAHAKTRSVCTRLKAASACLRHCKKMVNRSIGKHLILRYLHTCKDSEILSLYSYANMSSELLDIKVKGYAL